MNEVLQAFQDAADKARIDDDEDYPDDYLGSFKRDESDKNVEGYPRPVLDRNGHNTPIPWVSNKGPEDGEWARIDSDRAVEAEKDELCIVCGLTLTPDYIYLLVDSQHKSDQAPTYAGLSALFGELPSPTYVHPKCGQIAALYCPHLKRNKFPAETQNGQRLTHDALKELAHKSPAPHKTDNSHL